MCCLVLMFEFVELVYQLVELVYQLVELVGFSAGGVGFSAGGVVSLIDEHCTKSSNVSNSL